MTLGALMANDCWRIPAALMGCGGGFWIALMLS